MLPVLVTGGNGYLGGTLLRYLTQHRPDWDVHATFFSIPPDPHTPNAHALDLRERSSVERVLETARPSLIFHTAALNEGDAQDMYATNARGSEYLARGAGQLNARLIHLSSDVIFDGERGNYSEDDAPNPITPYAVSKADAERGVMDSSANAIIVRTSLIYGFKPLDSRTRSIRRGEMPRLFVDELRNPIWVMNLCEALTELAASDYRGILNVAGTQPLSRYEFGLKLMRYMGGDESMVTPMRSEESGLVRPRDCTLNLSRAKQLLKTELLGVDQVLVKTCQVFENLSRLITKSSSAESS